MKDRDMAKLVLLVCVCCLAGLAFAEPQTYPMVCRGGPGMRIMVNHDVDVQGIPGATAMFIYFKPAAKPGSAAPPQPGECVWMDRTLKSGEPTALWIRAPHVEFAFQVYGDGRIAKDGRTFRLNPEGNSDEAQKWRQLTDAVLNGAQFTVQVYNAGGRVLSIKSVEQ
jgi:hypothetical protein